jgi:hypothetical protein
MISERLRHLSARIEQARRAHVGEKRILEESSPSDSKRPKLGPDSEIEAAIAAALTDDVLERLDFWRGLDAATVTEIIVANLQRFSEDEISSAIEVH